MSNGKNFEFDGSDFEGPEPKKEPIQRHTRSKTPNLDLFGKDLTKLAAEGKLDPVIGRDEEIYKIIQILNKRKKNNPIIVSEAGVGKTALVEGLAIKIAKKEVDRWLFNKKIIELNITSIVSGTKYRGEFEQRMEDIVREIKDNQDIIVFIDEIHNIVGAGGASGSMDASNIIKPALARGEMHCIGATTLDEFKKVIENEGALERRFQKVYLTIPTKDETIEILKKIKYKYEEYHGVNYSDEVIEKCVDYSDKYITYRNFPDKAIDILDEVGAKAKLKLQMPDEIKVIEKTLEEISERKTQAATTQKYEEAARLRDKERELKVQIEEEILKWDNIIKKKRIDITTEDVAYVISSHTGIPLKTFNKDDDDKIYKIEEYLKENIIGQDEAVIKVCEAIQRSKIGIQDPEKPQNFLFLGPTGVGKTQLAKTLANYLFSTKDSFIRFDMSEFTEKFNITKLIGAPPGFIGYEEKGQLTEKVKNRPYSIVLFDEIEKAHPEIFSIFLQILDEGRLTDAMGKEVNFKNTIIIMTSNIGTDKILNKKSLGFDMNTNNSQNTYNIVMEELKKYFKPELINRIGEKIVFNTLNQDDVVKVVELELKKVLKRIEEKGFSITIGKEVKEFIANIGYEKEYGARPLKRAIVENVENVIARSIFNKEIDSTKPIKLVLDKKSKQVIAKN